MHTPFKPESDSGYRPVTHGPSWGVDSEGKWILPEYTIGWEILDWSSKYLRNPDGTRWMFTPEQARIVLWWYAFNPENGAFIYRDSVIQRIKGWGKDPFAAALCGIELVGPCRPKKVNGSWVAVDMPNAWIQIAAVSKDQTRNTMTIFPTLFTDFAIKKFRIEVRKEIVYAHNSSRRIEAVTSAPRALEGGRPTFTVANETHHWLKGNEGHAMWDVIDRNSVKGTSRGARTMAITNSYDPSEDSVAQRTREAWEETADDDFAGIMYDSLEAPDDAPLTPDVAPIIIKMVRGDSHWVDVDGVVASILDPRNAPSRSRRFWYNKVEVSEDAWVDIRKWDEGRVENPTYSGSDEWSLFFDGGKSDDSTALVGCRVSDGLLKVFGLWQKPPGDRGFEWLAPRAEVDFAVRKVLDNYRVVGFWADPSHAKDDEHDTPYWDSLIDGWHRDYKRKLSIWAKRGDVVGHSVMWDMSNPIHQQAFCDEVMRFGLSAEEGLILHDGDKRLRSHVRNAKRFPTKYGVSIYKGSRGSRNKIDLAVAAVGAALIRREYLNTKKPTRSGKVWGI